MIESKKPKSKKGLIMTLIIMNLLIGFMLGFSVTMYIPIEQMQNIFLNFDQEVMNVINSLASGIRK